MFIISLTYKTEISVVEQHIEAHISYLDKYYALGNFVASGRKVPRTGGVILAIANDREQIEQIVREDPFYREGVADFEVTEFMPSKTADKLAVLKTLG